MIIDNWFSIVSGLMAFVSAALWIMAARARAPDEPQKDKDGWYAARISVDGTDLIETLKKQGEWNSWAAYSAALAAFLQGVVIAMPFLR
jgi:hypothetical protein